MHEGTIHDTIDHPAHYGGDYGFEPIKVIEAWDLGFHLGNTVKYIARAGKKGPALEDLKKARWYLDREIENRTKQDWICDHCGQPYGADRDWETASQSRSKIFHIFKRAQSSQITSTVSNKLDTG